MALILALRLYKENEPAMFEALLIFNIDTFSVNEKAPHSCDAFELCNL